MAEAGKLEPGTPRSIGARSERRVPQAWPKDRKFRILSLDGGGIRGIFPATVLAELERRHLGDRSIARHFDLIAGTSTGGILALALASGMTARELSTLYRERGGEIFPPGPDGILGKLWRVWRKISFLARYRYDRDRLEALLREILGDRLYGQASTRLCIPAFDGKHGEVFVFKTPHHPDYKTDRHEQMVKVALATAAAPAFFRPFKDGGFTFVDGGVWANNPIMLAVIEALTCFDLDRGQIEVLTIGCGDDPYVISGSQMRGGGLFAWRSIFDAAIRLQSLSATNQARLLLGPNAVQRIDAPTNGKKIDLDNWLRATSELPPLASAVVETKGAAIAAQFLLEVASPYQPSPISV